MKIIQIGSFPIDTSLIKGGVEASVYGLATEQAKHHEVFVLDLPRFEVKKDVETVVGGCKVQRFSNKKNSNIYAILRLKSFLRIIKILKPEICHLHTTSLFTLLCFILLRFNKIPCIITVHGLAHIEKKNIFNKNPNIQNFTKYINQSITEFIFLSSCSTCIVDTQYVFEAIKQYKKEHKILRIPTCIVIPQGINSVYFEIVPEIENLRILSVGTFSRRKGHHLLIEAMKIVYNKFPAFRLDIVGIVSEKLYFEKLELIIKESGLSENIKLHPNTNFENLIEMYSAAQLFVLHSEEESQGIVFCEAMASRKPIVATNVGGVSYIIENNKNGLLSEYGDVELFASNIIHLLTDSKTQQEMVESNRNDSQTYKWEIIENKIFSLYQSIIKA